MKQCMYIEVRPQMCGDSRCGMLTLIGDSYCIDFINLISDVAAIRTQRLAISVGPN
jgi:hypothetical protein